MLFRNCDVRLKTCVLKAVSWLWVTRILPHALERVTYLKVLLMLTPLCQQYSLQRLNLNAPPIGSIIARNCPKAAATDGLFVLTVFISDLYPASIRPVIFATLLTAQGNSCAHWAPKWWKVLVALQPKFVCCGCIARVMLRLWPKPLFLRLYFRTTKR